MTRASTLSRRGFLRAGAGGLAAAGGLGAMHWPGMAAGGDYRALVVLFLNGGSDGNNTLIPTDTGAYLDYKNARQNLAIAPNALASLPGRVDGRAFGIHPSLAPLVARYSQERLAFIANVGPLIEPATAAQVLDNAVDVPPFLLSHSDQTHMVQGWTMQDDFTGWAGRGLELLPSRLRHGVQAITTSTARTLVLGKRSMVSFLPNGGDSWWGMGDLRRPQDLGTQSLQRMAQWQFSNAYEAEYARTFGNALSDSAYFGEAYARASLPGTPADFGKGGAHDWLADQMRNLAGLLPVFKADGLKRQVILVPWGGFDTHTNQRGPDMNTQDQQFVTLAKALAAFDAANIASGLGDDVVTLVMSEFGRTIRPGSGGGSEHAWGSHWMLMGGMVAGGTVHGIFPSLVLGGVDDGDGARNGRHVPTTSVDQVGATLMKWLGLDPGLFGDVFPNIGNFQHKTLPLLRA
jgi:uncharacterized protein (DUF1501 family)